MSFVICNMAQCIVDPSRITELFQISSVVKDMLQTEMKTTGANHLNHNMFLVLRERKKDVDRLSLYQFLNIFKLDFC